MPPDIARVVAAPVGDRPGRQLVIARMFPGGDPRRRQRRASLGEGTRRSRHGAARTLRPGRPLLEQRSAGCAAARDRRSSRGRDRHP